MNRPWNKVLEHCLFKTIAVEIGSIRIRDNYEGDGYSTIIWAANFERVYSVDIDPQATELTQEETKRYGNVEAITCDGIEFLSRFGQPIDLLYLDGWDAHLENSAENHLLAYEAARPFLHSKSIVLIDDTFHTQQGKGALVIPRMVEDGWTVVMDGYQTLLAKKEKS